MNSDSIIISLNESTYPNINHKINNLIQQRAISSLEERFKLIIENATKYNPTLDNDEKEDEHFRRKHETIALLGERGTGKTNFLLNIKTILNKYKNDLVFLKVLDPTLFEDRQNILIVIIALIEEKINEKRKEEDIDRELYTKWINCFKRLAEGLNLIDENVGSHPMKKDIWDDPYLILEKGISSSLSGYGFEKNLHFFLFYTTKLLNVKLLVLRFDDIDTNPEKGWNVLEVIRKYLTSPHLQIIISGDWKLYSKIVRIEQWKRLHALQEYEKDINLKPTVDNLEEQYLSKIMQPQHRIYLRTIRHLTFNNEYKQNLIIYGDNIKKHYKNDMTIKDIYINIFKNVFNMSDNMLGSSCALLMQLPVRINIQILIAYDESLVDSYKLDIEKFMGKFVNIFLTLADRFHFPYRDFQKLQEPSGYSFLANKLLQTSKENNEISFKSLLSTHTNFANDDINLLVLFIHGFVVQSMNESVNLIFDWYYRVYLLSKIQLNYKENEFNNVLEYMDYQKRVSTYKITIKHSGLLESESNSLIGHAEVYRDQKYANSHSAINTIEKRIYELDYYSDIEGINKFLELLLSIVSKNIITKKGKETHTHISFHFLAGFISNILESENSEFLVKRMSYPNTIYQYSLVNNDSRISYGEKIFSEDTKYNEVEKLILKLEEWKDYKKTKLDEFTLQQIGTLWNEFEDRENNINFTTSAGEYLEIQIYIFLDSLLRSSMTKQETYKIIKDPKVSKNMFQQNLNTYYADNKTLTITERIETIRNKDSINLFEFFMLCPLWNYYVDFSEDILIERNEEKETLMKLEELGKKQHVYSGFFSEIEIYSSKQAVEGQSLFDRSINKSDKEIIRDEYMLIDEKRLFNSIKQTMKVAKNLKRISRDSVYKWIEIYNEIEKK